MRETQKEFFDFLEKEDAGLLEFGDEELKDEEEEEQKETLTKQVLAQWKKDAYTSV